MTTQPKIDSESLQRIRASYNWFLKPVTNAVDCVQKMPFFGWMKDQSSILDFKPVATQVYYHSLTLPRAIGLMLSVVPNERSELYQPLSQHAYEEADHHLLLVDWMVSHGLIRRRSDLHGVAPTIETSSCINIAYEIAMSRDCDMWIACMNSAIELCFFRFFSALAPKMHSLGAGHKYFDIHVEADAEHSVMGLKYISCPEENTSGCDRLRSAALNSISLWAGMVHSWIGLTVLPKFNLDGTLKV